MSLLTMKKMDYPDIGSFITKLKPQVQNSVVALQRIQYEIEESTTGIDIETLLIKFGQIYEKKQGELTNKELTTLCYHCTELYDDACLFFLKEYIIKYWNRTCFKGLMSSVLQNWHNEMAEHILHLLISKENEMSEIQNSAFKYFSSKEKPRMLAQYIKEHGYSLLNSPSFVLLKDSSFSYSYFEDVISPFFEKISLDDNILDLLEDVIDAHKNSRYCRILLPQIIIENKNKYIDEDEKKRLIEICENRIGNPHKIIYWQDEELTKDQQNNLIQARNIILNWILGRVIDDVFTKSSSGEYPDRARFWRRYSKTMLDMNDNNDVVLRVVSTDYLSEVFSINERQTFYKRLYEGPSNTAVIMKFGMYAIIELLQGGCIYVYRKTEHEHTGGMYERVLSNAIFSINDLKEDGIIELLQADVMWRCHFPNSFKIAHRGNWEDTFDYMLTTIGIRPRF